MRTLKFIAAGLVAACALSSGCTCNNGDIGNWFGTWHLEKIQAEGKDVSDYQGNIFWQFQSDVINMTELTPGGYHERANHWGTWKEQNNTLSLDFNHPVNPGTTTPSSSFEPPLILHLPLEADLAIDKFSSSRLIVTYNAADATYKYILKKQ